MAIRSLWRRLSARDQALLVLAHLHNGDTYARLAAGFGVGVATVYRYRYLREAVDLLVARAPTLTAALWALTATFNTFAILDETVVRIDRLGGANNRRYYAGKHRHHEVNLQGLTDPHGRLIFISARLLGSVHDLTTACAHEVLTSINRVGLHLFADKGYLGDEADLLLVPSKGRTCRRPTAMPTERTPLSVPAANRASPP